MAGQRFELFVVDVGELPEGVAWPPGADPLRPSEYSVRGRELLIVIDGVAALGSFGLGLEPDELLDPSHPLLPPSDGSAVVRIVQRCGCGETGCGSLRMTIQRDGDDVVWSDATTGDRPIPVGPFRFAAEDYEAVVRAAHDERPWESRSARIARLLGYRYQSEPDARGLRFDWASRQADDAVVVSFSRSTPNPNAGQRTRSWQHPTNGSTMYTVEPDDLVTQFLGLFPIVAGPDEDVVSDLEARITSTEPESWELPPRPRRTGSAHDASDTE